MANAPSLKTEQYKKLIQTKCPDVMKSTDGQVFASILISLSERVDVLERKNSWLVDSVQAMAKVLQAITVGEDEIETSTGTEAVTDEPGFTPGSGGGAAGSAASPQRDERYNQPFPAGVPASKAEADAKKAAAPPVPERAADDLTPNVAGSPSVNAQPIPKNPNGKGANA